nr:UDP-glucuronate 4-epimerase 3 [Ipomoea batatas]
MTGLSHLDALPSTPGKLKTEKGNFYRLRLYPSHFPRFTLGSFVLIFCVLLFLLCSPPGNPAGSNRRNLTDIVAPARTVSLGPNWERRVRASALPKSKKGFSILVTGTAGFVGSHVSLALKRRGDGLHKGHPERKRSRYSRRLGRAVARDFTYIDDVVKGCLAASTEPPETSPTLTMLVGILEKLLKVKAKKKVVAMPRNGDVPFTHANITLAQRELGYKPSTDLEIGLKEFVKWYMNYYGNKRRSEW